MYLLFYHHPWQTRYSFLPNETHDCKKITRLSKQSKMHSNVNFSGAIRQISVILIIWKGVNNYLNDYRTLWEPSKNFYTRVFHLEVESMQLLLNLTLPLKYLDLLLTDLELNRAFAIICNCSRFQFKLELLCLTNICR